ncbi:MAG: hypothetical protein ACTH2O_09080, partial [Cellulosimicrobium funkei]
MRRRGLAQDRAARAGHVTHEPTSDGAGTAVGGFELLPPELRSDDRFDAALDAALASPAEAPVRRPPDGPRPRDEDGPPATRGGHHDRVARDVLPLSRPQDERPPTAHDTPGLARSGAPRPSRSAGGGESPQV